MDELEMLKKDWQKRSETLPSYTQAQLHQMLWKQSSSLVRWIFIISIIEITLPNLLYLFPSMRDGLDLYRKVGVHRAILAITIAYYAAVAYYVFRFYRNYREISVMANAKVLMDQILKTRRTVREYIMVCLGLTLLIMGVFLFGAWTTDDIGFLFEQANTEGMDMDDLKNGFLIAMSVFCLLLIVALAGFYFLIYGFLLRKLKRNYSELGKMEV